MFTGIIKETGHIQKATKQHGSLFLTIQKPVGWKLKPGDSVATNGVCLTVQKVIKNSYATELMPETLRRSTFGREVPKMINLERPLRLGDFVDGHLVQGHVDTVGKIILTKKQARAKVFRISFPKQFKRLVVSKGSIAVDGVSLTVSALGTGWFEVSLVDYSLQHTMFGKRKIGDAVNIEFDIMGKYYAKS